MTFVPRFRQPWSSALAMILALGFSSAAIAAEPEEMEKGFDAVRAVEREPPPGTPLIANKLFPMQFRLEFTGMFDYSFPDKFISHIGGHAGVGFHIFDWLAVEGFAGVFYPRELSITKTVRQQGYSFTQFQQEPRLTDLWQSFAYGGANAQWAPLYGKLSIVSEFDISFQLYFLGGVAVEGIAKPIDEFGSASINTQRDFYAGVASGKQYHYSARVSAVYGAGVRLIPWSWMAIRLQLRNFSGINPAVPNVDNPPLDIGHVPVLELGLSFLL